MLENTDSVAPQKRASEVTSSLSLKETNVEDMAVQYLLLLSSLGNIDARDRAISVFRNMMGNRMGFQGCCDIYRAARHALDNEVVKNLVPAIQEKAEQWPVEFADALNSDVSHYLIKLSGLSESRQFLDHLRKLINRYESINQRKLTQTKKNNRSIRKVIRRFEKTFHKTQNKNCIKRALSFTNKAQFRNEYPVYIESLMRSELEITARELLYRKVYPNFHEAITNQIERLNLITKNIISAAEEAKNETNRLKNLPDDFYTPVGCELADTKFINSKLNDVYAKQGGKAKNIEKIFETFIGRFKSLDTFINQDINRIEHHIIDFCRQTSLQVLWQLNILDVLQEAFPDKQHQHELICHLIRQSNGRVKVSGEADQEIPKLKYICGPDPGIINWAVRIANEIERRGVDWRGLVIEGLSSLFFFQYRAQISVSRLIADTFSIYQPPHHVKELVLLGESPITALIPLPGCDNDNLDRVIAQGLLSKVIIKGKDGYELKKPLVKPKYIGKTASQIRESLSRNFADIVYINQEFALKLAKEGNDLDHRFPEYMNSSEGTEPSLTEIGEMPFRTTVEIVDALMPYLSRLPRQDIRIR